MIEKLWQELKNDADSQKLSRGLIRRRIHPESKQDLYLALERPGDVHGLLLTIPADSIPSGEALPQTEGFALIPLTLLDERDHISLLIRLTDQSYKDIFTVLVEDVVEAVRPSVDEKQMLNTLLSRLLAWQRFLKAQGTGCLGDYEQQGLYGELWFLNHVLIDAIGENKAAQAWVGPSGASQDFQFSHGAIEVKTTSTKELIQLKISNERQLDDTGLPGLWLFHLSLDVSKTAGDSLPDMVNTVRQRFANNVLSLRAFEISLLSAGYLDMHAEHYEKNRYRIREENVFLVEGNFPRISRGDLRSGVGDVRYAISLAECKHYSVDFDEFLKRISEEKPWN